MFICSLCKKPYPLYGHPNTDAFCHCSTGLTIYATITTGNSTTSTGFGEITSSQPLPCPNYERTKVPQAFYDAFDEDTKT